MNIYTRKERIYIPGRKEYRGSVTPVEVERGRKGKEARKKRVVMEIVKGESGGRDRGRDRGRERTCDRHIGIGSIEEAVVCHPCRSDKYAAMEMAIPR